MKKPLLSCISRMLLLATSVLVLLAIPSLAQTYTKTTLHYFAGGTDGAFPNKRLILDQAGNIYGVTPEGGAGCVGSEWGCGIIFKIDTSGHETVLYAFDEHNGWESEGRLTMDAAGNLYGTTLRGGPGHCHCGVVFKLDTSGTYTVLYAFTSGGGGVQPQAGLLYVASEGALYGSTPTGSKNSCGNYTCGIVFKLAPNSKGKWVYTVLHSFDGSDGYMPLGELTRDVQGNLYGTTELGGASNLGTVFKLRSHQSHQETVLYSFMGGADGAGPSSGLLRGAAGNLYGTTQIGGGTGCQYNEGCGTIYKLDAMGHETVLHAFTDLDGTNPLDRLVTDAAGNLYGTTEINGENGFGTVYKLDTSGTYSVLYSFGGTDGEYPAGLAIDAAGNLYGTTQYGGLPCPHKTTCGTVFKLTPQ
jgi:uncharacterized repeat protein (TIGR03803 family)